MTVVGHTTTGWFPDPRKIMLVVGPLLVGPHLVDPHLVGPHLVGPHLVDPHLVDPHLVDQSLTKKDTCIAVTFGVQSLSESVSRNPAPP